MGTYAHLLLLVPLACPVVLALLALFFYKRGYLKKWRDGYLDAASFGCSLGAAFSLGVLFFGSFFMISMEQNWRYSIEEVEAVKHLLIGSFVLLIVNGVFGFFLSKALTPEQSDAQIESP